MTPVPTTATRWISVLGSISNAPSPGSARQRLDPPRNETFRDRAARPKDHDANARPGTVEPAVSSQLAEPAGPKRRGIVEEGWGAKWLGPTGSQSPAYGHRLPCRAPTR